MERPAPWVRVPRGKVGPPRPVDRRGSRLRAELSCLRSGRHGPSLILVARSSASRGNQEAGARRWGVLLSAFQAAADPGRINSPEAPAFPHSRTRIGATHDARPHVKARLASVVRASRIVAARDVVAWRHIQTTRRGAARLLHSSNVLAENLQADARIPGDASSAGIRRARAGNDRVHAMASAGQNRVSAC